MAVRADEQEFVIGGYTDPRGGRVGFGALLVGLYHRGELLYAGKVGTGFDHTPHGYWQETGRNEAPNAVEKRFR